MRGLGLLAALLGMPDAALAQEEQAQEPPVGVFPMPSGDVTPEIVTAIRDAVVAQLDPMVEGREVRALENEQRLIAILECADAACIGAQVAELGAIAGVLVRIHREPPGRGRAPPQPVSVTIEVVDPVSGSPRLAPVQAQVPADQLAAPAEALAPATAQLAAAMPAPPPKSSLLVAVNVDGATVKIDGEEVGQVPIAPVEVAPGRHIVEVTRPGFVPRSESVEVGRGESARLDVLLEVDPGNVELLNADGAAVGVEGGGAAEPPWYTRWYVIAGAGVVLAAVLVTLIAVAASGGDDGQTGGIPIPPIE